MLKALRVSLAFLWFAISTSIYSILLLFRRGNPHNGVFVTHPIGKGVLKILGIQLEIENYEILKSAQPCVYLANHQHLLDVFTFCSNFPDHTFVVAKKSLKYTPFFGWTFSLSNNVYIDRENKKNAVKTLASAEARIHEGWSFFVFPEGTRSRGKGLGKFKKGAFHVAKNCNVPLVPWVCKKYDINLNSLKPSIVKMKVFAPITINSNEDLDKQIENIHAIVKGYQES